MEMAPLISAMKDSISEVLETMFFLPLEFSDHARFEEWWSEDAKDGLLITRLNFKGPLSGMFYFFIPKSLGLSLAACFMGEEEMDVSHEHGEDTVKEIINMIAGNTFGSWDDQAIFNLGIPEMINFEEAAKGHSDAVEKVFIGISTLDDSLALELVAQS